MFVCIAPLMFILALGCVLDKPLGVICEKIIFIERIKQNDKT